MQNVPPFFYGPMMAATGAPVMATSTGPLMDTYTGPQMVILAGPLGATISGPDAECSTFLLWPYDGKPHVFLLWQYSLYHEWVTCKGPFKKGGTNHNRAKDGCH